MGTTRGRNLALALIPEHAQGLGMHNASMIVQKLMYNCTSICMYIHDCICIYKLYLEKSGFFCLLEKMMYVNG